MPAIAFFGISRFDDALGGGVKNDTALAPSCTVVIITTNFSEFMHNRLGGDSVTDGQRQTDR